MQTYLSLLKQVLNTGQKRTDRTGTGTLSVFAPQLQFDLTEGFPLVTTKKVYVRSLIHELLWFLKGDTNIRYLTDNNVHIWDPWAKKDGNLGRVYGAQWRDWKTPQGKSVDQISRLVEGIKTNPLLQKTPGGGL